MCAPELSAAAWHHREGGSLCLLGGKEVAHLEGEPRHSVSPEHSSLTLKFMTDKTKDPAQCCSWLSSGSCLHSSFAGKH